MDNTERTERNVRLRQRIAAVKVVRLRRVEASGDPEDAYVVVDMPCRSPDVAEFLVTEDMPPEVFGRFVNRIRDMGKEVEVKLGGFR